MSRRLICFLKDCRSPANWFLSLVAAKWVCFTEESSKQPHILQGWVITTPNKLRIIAAASIVTVMLIAVFAAANLIKKPQGNPHRLRVGGIGSKRLNTDCSD